MHNSSFPIFTKGRVVKKEALERLRDYPHTLASIAFDDFSDGILHGFTIFFNKDKNIITVSKGAIKFNDRILTVHENEFPLDRYGIFLYIKLIVEDCCEDNDFKFYPIELKIDDNKDLKENELELGRFCLNESAVLRCKYDSFADYRTPLNTLDITHCFFAGVGEATLHPFVLKGFAKELLDSSSDAIDIAFALLCLNSGLIHKNSIEWYIAKKVGNQYREYGLDELYKKLAEILSDNTKKEPPASRARRKPRISL